jgi:hypothetical protein
MANSKPSGRRARITVDLPLYDAFWKLDPRIKRRFPGANLKGENALGVMFVSPRGLRAGKPGGYFCSPTNTVLFADTGGDGSHFSFLVRDSRIDFDSPIVVTAPANIGNHNRILAENFETFLRLGLRRGYFAMEQFAYFPQEALHVYGKPNWKPTKKSHYSVGYVPDERQQKVLAFVADELELKPLCYSPRAFAKLQRQWLPELQMSAEYYEV